jgi:four helix bundle protein
MDIIRSCLQLGCDDLGQLIRPQLLRAGTGVATNHRASHRARSGREFISRISIAIEEAEESEFWLGAVLELKYGPQDEAARLHRESDELLRIFAKSRSTPSAGLNG